MSDDVLKNKLWTPRPVEETLQIYADWADSYDADVTENGYATPTRLALTLAEYLTPMQPILDFGCGTGLSGAALRDAGFKNVSGTDISAQMLDKTQQLDIYQTTWQSQAGTLDIPAEQSFDAIVATGVISLGAAPPETLDLCLNALPMGGILAFSFNDPTLPDGSYDAALDAILQPEKAEMLHRAHGPHLPGKGMGSDIILIKKI